MSNVWGHAFDADLHMGDGYPFTGTGNLHKFCQGLVSIGIENRVLVVYDNDAEGWAKHRDTTALRLPRNLRSIRLPDDERLDAFPTRGPEGAGVADINGRAAAIECYLDLRGGPSNPSVRWTSYHRAAERYQGELEGKEAHARRFLRLRAIPSGYDTRGIELVLDTILAEGAAIARTGC